MADLSHTGFGRARNGKQACEAEIDAERDAINRRLAAITQSRAPASTGDLPGENNTRRRSPRKNVVKLARIYLNKIDFIRCVVINLSADGARIQLEDDHDVPQFFELRFEESGIQKKAKIAWRHKNEFGLSFLRKDKKEEKADNGIHYRTTDYLG